MKRMMTNAIAIAAAASWVMVAGAQSSTGATQSEQSRSEKTMKYTGCLQEGDTPNSYKLTNVQPADPSRSGTTSGTSGSGTTGSGTTGSGTTGSGMGSSMMENELELVPSGTNVDLREHVGKRVEITAKAMKSSEHGTGTSGSGTGTSGSGTTGSGTTGSGQSGMHGEMGKKKVQVTAIRSLGGSC